MGDNRKRLRAIRKALNDAYPGEPKGNQARHLNVLAAIINGIVGTKSSKLRDIAQNIPDDTKVESRVKRISRLIKNDGVTPQLYFSPFAESLLRHLNLPTLVLAMDGSTVAHGCLTLMVSVIYKKRALPIAWTVVQGKKGHFPEQAHIALIEQVETLVPDGAEVVFVGDGEFDGVDLQATLHQWGWHYVCRTAKTNKFFFLDGKDYKGIHLGALVKPGGHEIAEEVLVTDKKYGPVQLICWWAEGYKEPIYLVTNMACAEQAYQFYRRRFSIETFFSDQKSRGFNLHKSHLSDPKRVSCFMIAASLAYIWMIYLGQFCMDKGWNAIIHRIDRCDLSLFQLGLGLLDELLNQGLDIPVQFRIPLHTNDSKSVRC